MDQSQKNEKTYSANDNISGIYQPAEDDIFLDPKESINVRHDKLKESPSFLTNSLDDADNFQNIRQTLLYSIDNKPQESANEFKSFQEFTIIILDQSLKD